MKKCLRQKKFITKVVDFVLQKSSPKINYFIKEFCLSETFFHFSSMKIVPFGSLMIANTLFFNLGVPNCLYFFISLCTLQTNSVKPTFDLSWTLVVNYFCFTSTYVYSSLVQVPVPVIVAVH